MVCQTSSDSLQILLERPSSSEFVGSKGLSPPKTLKTTPELGNLPCSGVPAGTYKVGIKCVRTGHRTARTRYITIAVTYASASFIGVHFPSPNTDGARCSGATKGVFFPPVWDFDDSIPRPGSYGPEVRETCQGGVGIRDQDVSLNNHMRGIHGTLTERLTPFESPCTILAS